MNYKISILLSVLVCQGCFVAAAGGAATGTVIAIDRRTTGTIVDDKTTEMKALNALSKRSELWKKSHLSVISYNNVIVLVGQTPTEELRAEAEEAVSDLPKVRRVHNELSVENPNSLSQRAKDTWITTQIKSKMIGNREIHANRVKVITENGVVYLLGLTTPEEEEIVTNIASDTPGVEKIVQIFERH